MSVTLPLAPGQSLWRLQVPTHLLQSHSIQSLLNDATLDLTAGAIQTAAGKLTVVESLKDSGRLAPLLKTAGDDFEEDSDSDDEDATYGVGTGFAKTLVVREPVEHTEGGEVANLRIGFNRVKQFTGLKRRFAFPGAMIPPPTALAATPANLGKKRSADEDVEEAAKSTKKKKKSRKEK